MMTRTRLYKICRLYELRPLLEMLKLYDLSPSCYAYPVILDDGTRILIANEGLSDNSREWAILRVLEENYEENSYTVVHCESRTIGNRSDIAGVEQNIKASMYNWEKRTPFKIYTHTGRCPICG